MNRVKVIVMFTVLSACSAAPTSNMEACMSITNDDSVSMGTCCNYTIPFTNETMMTCAQEETNGTQSKEFECVQDCLFSSAGVLGPDKKFDPNAWKTHATKTVTGDWRDVVANSGNDCEGFKKIMGPSMEMKCPTSKSDIDFNCMAIQWYLNCPKSAWTSSESCESSRKKLSGCFGPLFQSS